MNLTNLIKRSASFLLLVIALQTLILILLKHSYAANCTVSFNEILPDPSGTDTGNEWVELYNCTDSDIDLTNWYIKDKSGAKQILKDIIIQPKDFQIIYTTVSLNQTNEELYLFNPNGQQIDFFNYATSQEGLSWARTIDGEGEWKSDQIPTPGDKNIYIDTSDCFYNSRIVTVAEARTDQSTDSEEKLQITGIVTALPGQIYQNKIYIQDQSAGILVSLPISEVGTTNFQIGNNISLAGTYSTYYNEPEIRLNSINCLKINNDKTAQVLALTTSLDQDSLLQNAGKLIQIKGNISKISGNTFWFDSSDGFEVKVTIPKNITGIIKKKGDLARITGILSVSDNNLENAVFKVIPRTAEDIDIQTIVSAKSKAKTTSTSKNKKTDLQITSKSTTNSQAQRDKQQILQQSLRKPVFSKYKTEGKKLAVKREIIDTDTNLKQIGSFASGSSFITSISTIFLIFRRK